MRRRPAETGAGCVPPLKQILQTPSSPGPTSAGHRGTPAFPFREPCVTARSRLPHGRDRSCPSSISAPRGRLMSTGNSELERSAPPCFRFYPDSSPLALDYLLTKGKPDARAGDFISVQAPEHAEHSAGVLRIDADSVVPHGEQPPFPVSYRRDVDSWRFLASVLNRVGNEVLKDLCQHDLFGSQSRQRIEGYDGATLRDGRLEVQQRIGEDCAAIDRSEAVLLPPVDLPIGKQGLQ